jgi:hypothetical protein
VREDEPKREAGGSGQTKSSCDEQTAEALRIRRSVVFVSIFQELVKRYIFIKAAPP